MVRPAKSVCPSIETYNTIYKVQDHIATSPQHGLSTRLSSYGASPLRKDGESEHIFQLDGALGECPGSPTTSSCFSEHSCCDNPACDFSTTDSVPKSVACSLEACLNPESCDKVECCSDEACIHPGDLNGQYLSSAHDASEILEHHPIDLSDVGNNEALQLDGSLSCQWLETDHQCSVTALPAALSQHVFKDHIEQNTWLPCGWAQCDQTVESQQLLQHVAQAHPPDQYVCLWQGCGYSFSSDEELAAHMSAMHCTKLDCHWGGCEYIHMDPIALKSHVTDEHLNIHPPATFSSHPYSSGLSSPSVAASVHQISQPSNSSSFGTPPPPPQFALHLPGHGIASLSVSGRHQCLWTIDQAAHTTCAASFAHENDLQTHLEEAHLKQLSARTNPLRTGIFVCKWQGCKANGSSHNGKDKLRKHTYTHTGCYYYQCHICSHKFALKGPYENHLRIHTGEKPFKCDKCESTFPSKESLTNHMRTHTGEKHLKCEICGFQCGDSSNLSKHRKTHKPPVNTCSVCKKAFCRPDSLKRHMIQHEKVAGQKRRHAEIAQS